MDETKLVQLQADLKGYFEKAAEEKTKFGATLDSTISKIDALQKQVDAIDAKMASPLSGEAEDRDSIDVLMKQDEGVQRLLRDKRGAASLKFTGKSASGLLERKTTITSGASGTVGASTSGVLQIGRLDGLTTEARQLLTVRDLLTARATTFQVIDFVRVNAPMTIASPVAEAALKPENAVTFNTVSERVKTIATLIPATRQVLDDFPELLGFIKQMLPFYVDLAEEQQLLSGDGTGENLHGLIPQATAFSAGLLSAVKGWNKIDILGRSMQQITAAKELPPTFVVLHPNDWWDIRLQKDGFGRYILGDPQQGALNTAVMGQTMPTQNIFGLKVCPTTSIAAGTFLIGSGSPMASEIRDRLEMQVDISTEHADFFQRNLLAVRAEKRLCLIVRRPASYISGTFTTSP